MCLKLYQRLPNYFSLPKAPASKSLITNAVLVFSPASGTHVLSPLGDPSEAQVRTVIIFYNFVGKNSPDHMSS